MVGDYKRMLQQHSVQHEQVDFVVGVRTVRGGKRPSCPVHPLTD